jgi:hypothetical protein
MKSPYYTVRSPDPPYSGPIFDSEKAAREWLGCQETEFILERHDSDGVRTRLQNPGGRDE